MKKSIFFSFCMGAIGLKAVAQPHNFDAVMQCHTSSDAPGMAFRLDQSGQHIFSGALGMSNIEGKRKLRVDDLFQIGSVTKTFTAAAILKLSENNKLSLNDTLGKFIPYINSGYKNLTIDRVLSHTSGLSDYLGDPAVNNVWDKYASVDEVIRSISNRPLRSKSGEMAAYSNLGYILLGKVIEVASGLPYHEYMHRTFFKPLKMEDTFVMTKGTEIGEVSGYTSNQSAPTEYLKADASNERAWKVDRSWIYSAGAIVSTLSDMNAWAYALKSGKVISKDSFALMAKKAVLNDKSTVNFGYGLGINKIGKLEAYSHDGMVPGFFTWTVHFPNQELVATAFSNLDTKHPGPALLDMIALQLGLSPKPIGEEEVKATAASLVGSYLSPDSKILNISFENGTLYSHYVGEEKRKLIPRENNSYSYECTENYFQLRKNNGKDEIVPVYLFQGEQQGLIKLQIQ